MKILHRLFLLAGLISGPVAYAQTDHLLLATAVNNLKDTYGAKPVEKVYLHLDKPNYFPGDTIWFKAYTVVGYTHGLSALSGVVYAELLNPQDSLVRRINLHLTAGVAWGDFALSGKLKPGNYHLRAYTNWMRNAGSDYFYDQRVNIGGIAPGALLPSAATTNPDVQFFPEGGELVAGIRSKVAFKAIGVSGAGENIKGSVTDNEGTVAAEFESTHAGMGIFALVPQPGKIYTAKITLKDGRTFAVALPKVQEEGYTLSVNNARKDSIFIKVTANSKTFQAKQNSSFFIIGQSNGAVYYTAEGTLKSPVFGTGISKERFPSGIVQFTLFADGGPVCERIAFIKSNDTLKIDLTSANKTYPKRGEVKLDFSAKNDAGTPIAGSFSIAVINESRVGADENAEGSIFSHLLLTSDLKGFVERPNYYFVDTTPAKLAELDVLMLTQGYRRFEWKQIIAAPDTRILNKPEKALSLEGTIKTNGGDVVPNAKLILTASRENTILDTVSDALGNFKFTNLALSDTGKIVLQARKQNNGKKVAIFVKQPQYPNIVKSAAGELASNDLSEEILRRNYAMYQKQLSADSLKYGKQLNEITVTAKKIAKPDAYNLEGGVPERAANMRRVNDFISLQEAFWFGLPFVKRNIAGQLSYEGKPVRIVLDGTIISSDMLYPYDPKEIDHIRLISAGGFEDGLPRPAYIVIESKKRTGTDTTALKQVTVTGKKIKRNEVTRSSNLHGPGNADQVIMGDKIGDCISLSDCLRGKVFGVSFKVDGTPVNISRGKNEDMVIIVDGSQLPGTELNNLNAADVLSIEVLRTNFSKAIYGSSIEGGALVITMKNGSERSFVTSASPSGLITYPFKGYYTARVYYTPKYKTPNTDNYILDLRSSIYWKPDVITGKDGKASFDFYNADTKGTYRVTIEGIDDDGNLGRQVYRYKVE